MILPPGDDPIPVLLSMQKFLPGEDRGLCEIVVGCDSDQLPSQIVLGITALIGHPEKTAMPIFDSVTREIACVELGTWLKARGFEASACRWERPGFGGDIGIANTKWRLVTGRAEVPPMPPDLAPLLKAQVLRHTMLPPSITRRLAYARR